jgi:hypothetical protein
MTDIQLGPDNDLLIVNGQINLIETTEVLVRQRLLNKLRAFTGTLFTNIDYGIRANLVFAKGTQSLLDQDIKALISNTRGVVKLVSYTSSDNPQRTLTVDFEYEIETGEIVGIKGLNVSGSSSEQYGRGGIWVNGIWDYSGTWDQDEIWGS